MSTAAAAALAERDPAGLDPDTLAERAKFIYNGRFRTIHIRTDRLFAGMILVEWIAAIAAAFLLQAGAPNGKLALLLGGVFALPPILLALTLPGKPITRHVVAIGQMLMSALLIHLSGGRMETHFHIFGSLAFLAFYRDWSVLLTASAVTTLDNYYRGLYLPESVYGMTSPAPWRWLEHLAWVAFEVAFLLWATNQGVREMHAAAERQAQAEVTNDALARAKTDLEAANVRLSESYRDTEERAREATASEAWFRALSSSSPLGVFEMNLNGAARYVNERFLSITGLQRDNALGDAWQEAVHAEDQETVRSLWRAAVAAGREFGGEFRVVRQGGDVRWVELRASVFHDPGSGGAATGYVGALADITERRFTEKLNEQKLAAEAALSVSEEARRNAEDVNRAKSQFLANMSHELRTPLNAIIGFSEILQDQTAGSLTPKQGRYVDNVLTSGRHLLQLINDILDLSKIEAGRMTLEYATFTPALAIRDVRNIIVALAHKKSQSVRVEVPDDLPPLEADQAKFKQILYNLLSNAVKFTPESKTITVRATANQATGMLTVAVVDEGIGLRSEHYERVFGEFEQLDSSYARAQQGTGLGLALTRRFVELHGGQIRVESEGEGKGSTFTFTLPLRRPRAAGEAEDPTQVPFSERPSVLVVDDDRASSELTRHHLERAGYRVAQVYRAGDALPAARELRPSAITLDVLLPDRDGWAALGALKADPVTAEIPVVMVSVTQDAPEQSVNLGAVACFVKAVDKERLIGAIEAFAADSGSGRPPRVLVVDDDPRTVEMLGAAMGQRGFEVVSALGGKEALERAVIERPDVIVLDLMMPEVSGFDVVDHLRARSDLRQIPVLIYTANDVSEEARDRLARHVQAITSKGGASGDLVAELGRVLSAAQRGPSPKAL